MIIDKIENLGRYSHLAKVKQFLDSHPEPLENGKYTIDDSCYVVASEYETKEDAGLFEGHEKYIDLQMLLCGSECIRVQTKSDCSMTIEYDGQKDAAFYKAEQAMNCYLDGSNFVLLAPDDLHDPGIMVGGKKEKVKKYVFKIKV